VSGSMGTKDSGTTNTRLALAKTGAKALLDKYDSFGDIMVQVVKFDSTATVANGGTWMSVSQAKTYIDGLSAGSYTNYDRAIETARTVTFDATKGAIEGARNVSYFFSDGNPTEDSAGKRNTSFSLTAGSEAYESQDIGIQSGEESAWKEFLNSHDVTSYAYAIGNGGVNTSYLNPIAWDGKNATDLKAGSISSANLATLPNHVEVPADIVTPPVISAYSGNFLDKAGAQPGPDGWDGSHKLVSITYGSERMFANSTDSDVTHGKYFTLTLANNQGTAVIYEDGFYTFTPGTGAAQVGAAGLSAVIGYKIQDSQLDINHSSVLGDTDTATFTIKIVDSDVKAYDNYNQATVSGSGSSPVETILYSGGTTGWHDDDDADVSDDSARLKITDKDGEDDSGGTATSPNLVISTAGSTLKFDAWIDSGNFASGDKASWKLQVKSGSDWDDVSSTGSSITQTSSHTFTTGALSAGTYRLVFDIEDDSNNSKDFQIFVDNIVATTPGTGTGVTHATGNVITDANYLGTSTDVWGSRDEVGADGATVTQIGATPWASLTNGTGDFAGYKEVTGTYGKLYIQADGDYVYVPDANAANAGQQDTFSYTLAQADGDFDTAQLVIGISNTLTGTASGESMTGTADNNWMLAQGGADTISGGEGQDVLVGGTGNDELTGGLGADVFKWSLTDKGTEASPAVDHIADFNKAEGDRINLADLLPEAAEANLSAYLSFGTDSVSGKAMLSVDVDATGGAEQKIVFDNMTLAQLQTAFGATDTAGDLIAKMKASGHLET
jgi:VCBS repeat-containing protein